MYKRQRRRRAWRAGGASDLHVASIVAATTIWTADKSVNALVVDELIERGHDVHARDGRGRTPLAFAFAVVGEWLDSPRCGGAAIWRKRVETGLLKTMRALRNDPLVARTTSDFDAADDLGATALHHAIGLERAALGEEVVDSLVLCGADPNRPLNNGDRPIHLACRHNPSVIAALLSGVGDTSSSDSCWVAPTIPICCCCGAGGVAPRSRGGGTHR